MIRKLIIFYLLSLFFVPQAYAQNGSNPGAGKLISELLILLKAHDFTKAAELFHYQNNFTHAEYLAEKKSVKESLEEYVTAFGNFQIVRRRTSKSRHLIGVGVSGGDLSDLAPLKKRIPAVLYEANFEKMGFGEILIWAAKMDDKWEILFLEYGFPKTDRIQKILSNMLKE